MKRVFLIALLFVFLLPQAGWACLVIGTKPEKAQEAIDAAFFIGKVKLVSINENPSLPWVQKIFYKKKEWGNPIEIKLMPLQSYKGSHEKIITAYAANDSCAKPRPKVGTIYEEIISQKQKYILTVSALPSLLPDETWEELRGKAQKSSQIEKIKEECAAGGGKWDVHKEYYLNIFDCSSGK